MKFTLDYLQANTLYEFAKAYCDKGGKPLFQMIHCKINDGILTATMVQGACGALVTMKVGGENGECYIVPPASKYKKTDYIVEIESDEKTTTYTTHNGSQVLKKPDCAEDYVFDLKPLFKDPIESVWFSPSTLAKCLSAFGDERVKIDFIGSKNGVVVTGASGKAIVLPMRPPQGE